MPRESIEQVRRQLEECSDYVRIRSSRPARKRRHRGERTPPALASTFVERRAREEMQYVFTRRFDLQLGGDMLVTLPCIWGDHAEPNEVLLRDPAHDSRIFWLPRRAPRNAFAVDRGTVLLSDPKLGHLMIGKVTDRDLVNDLWPLNGPRRMPGVPHE